VIVRPLAQDFGWDQYVDLTVRAFGPVDEVMVRPVAVPLLITDDLRPANSGRWDLTVRAGEGRLSRYRTVAPSPPPDGPSHAGCAPLALGARGLAALYAGTPVATLRRAGTLILADSGSQDADSALDGAFGAAPFMLDGC
jgi:hypothetical protein